MDSRLLYLAIDAICMLFPLAFSFDKRTRFFDSWRAILCGLAMVWVLFLPWDIAFTRAGHWGFNPAYTIGCTLAHLPVEEWLFFIAIPYACLFSHVSVGYYVQTYPGPKTSKRLALALMCLCFAFAVICRDNAYTFWTTMFTFVTLSVLLLTRQLFFFGRFLVTYSFVIIPFLLVNGVLTGRYFFKFPLWNTSAETVVDPVVWYNGAATVGLRVFSIPVEDFLYGFLMQLFAVIGFELYRSGRAKTTSMA